MIKVGFGTADITPPIGVELAGYGPFLRRYATGVLLPLQARAVAFHDGHRRWLLVSSDLLGVDQELEMQLRDSAQVATGWLFDEIVIHSTHTHSAPAAIRDFRGWGAADELYLSLLPYRVAEACRAAVEDLAPSSLFVGSAPLEGFARDRVNLVSGPERVDEGVDVVRVDRDGFVRGFIARYSCHPVVCGESTTLMHGDYPAFALAEVEGRNPGSIGVFLQGALGDIDPLYSHGPEEESYVKVVEFGVSLADAIDRAMQASRPDRVETVAISSQVLDIQLPAPNLDQLQAAQEKEAKRLRSGDLSSRDGEAAMSAVLAPNLRAILDRAQNGARFSRRLEFRALRAGSTEIATSNLELFHTVQRDVRLARGIRSWVISTTGPYIGYCPSEDAFFSPVPSYAAHAVPSYLGVPPFPSDIASQVSVALTDLLSNLDRSMEHDE